MSTRRYCLLVLDQTMHLVLAQAAAVQKGLAAAVALLRFPAVEADVRLQRRLFTVTGSTKYADVRPRSLRLVKLRAWIKVAIIITVLAQEPRVCERLATILAHVLPFQQLGVQILFHRP